MMKPMRDPEDEFGRYFRDLRKKKGWAADKLSRAVGKSKMYLGQWERGERKAVDRAVLLKASLALGLTDAELRKLFKLADLRHVPEEAHRFYYSTTDVAVNVRHALYEVDHDQLDDHSGSGFALQQFWEAVSWVLARNRAETNAPIYTDLDWPEQLYRERIIGPEFRGDRAIPAHLINEELPELADRLTILAEKMIHDVGAGMAAVWRRWFFADLSQVWPSDASFWSLNNDCPDGPVMSLSFSESETDKRCGIVRIGCNTVSRVTGRSLAEFMWSQFNRSGNVFSRYIHRFDPIDALALLAYRQAKDYLRNREGPVSGQMIRDAMFVVSSPPWLPHAKIDEFFYENVKSTVIDLTMDDIRSRRVLVDGRRDSLAQLQFEVADTLESALRRLEHESCIDVARINELCKSYVGITPLPENTPRKTKPATRSTKKKRAAKKKPPAKKAKKKRGK